MREAKLSPWTNKWSDIYDFTPGKTADSGKPNYRVSQKIIKDFISPFEEIKSLVDRVSKQKGIEITSLQQITEIDVAKLEEFESFQEDAEDLGQYFN